MIDINKEYKTRDGQDVRITGIHPNGWPVVCYISHLIKPGFYKWVFLITDPFSHPLKVLIDLFIMKIVYHFN